MTDPLDPIKPLLEDESTTEILIDGWENVYCEKEGKLVDAPGIFQNETQVYDLIRCIAEPLGRVVNESYPFVDCRLADGSLVNIIIPPIAINGPTLTIRKMRRSPIDMPLLLEYKCISQPMVDFLKACILARINIAISGGTGSGKTTLLNILCREIPDDERIVVCQHELFTLNRKRVINLETRPPNVEGRGEISMRNLITNASHMRPDRIIVTEVKGAEFFDLCNLMNTGHDGSMFSLHAANPYDALSRMEIMSSYANPSIPLRAMREQVASAVDIIIHQERLTDGTRKVMYITEVSGMDNGVITTRNLFEYRRAGIEKGRVVGHHTATGVIPLFLSRLQELVQYSGMEVPVSLFTPTA